MILFQTKYFEGKNDTMFLLLSIESYFSHFVVSGVILSLLSLLENVFSTLFWIWKIWPTILPDSLGKNFKMLVHLAKNLLN